MGILLGRLEKVPASLIIVDCPFVGCLRGHVVRQYLSVLPFVRVTLVMIADEGFSFGLCLDGQMCRYWPLIL